jgi:hypothetical protein
LKPTRRKYVRIGKTQKAQIACAFGVFDNVNGGVPQKAPVLPLVGMAG